MRDVVFAKQAAKDAKKLKVARLDKKTKDLEAEPLRNSPAYEALVGNLVDLYPRRISLQLRLVYQGLQQPEEVDGREVEGTVKVVRMWMRYEGLNENFMQGTYSSVQSCWTANEIQ